MIKAGEREDGAPDGKSQHREVEHSAELLSGRGLLLLLMRERDAEDKLDEDAEQVGRAEQDDEERELRDARAVVELQDARNEGGERGEVEGQELLASWCALEDRRPARLLLLV